MVPRVRTALATLGAIALALGTATARAAPTARLVYSRAPGAESCADEEALRRAVAARIGYDPFFPWATKTVIAGMAPWAPAGFVASVDLVDEHGMAHGARALRTEGSCDELLDAVALTIAIAIDPLSLAPRPASPPPPPAAPTAPSLPATTIVSPARPRTEIVAASAPVGSPLRIQGSFGAVASAGVAPRPTAGVAAGVSVRWRDLSLAVEARADLPVSAPAPIAGTVSSWLVEGALLPCAHADVLFACAVAQLGSLQAASERVLNGVSASRRWLSVGGRFGVQQPLGEDTVLRVWSDVVRDLQPETLQVNGAKAWQAPGIASSLGIDAVVQF